MVDKIIEKTDCWDNLKAESRPIFIYGMGDGAEKIMKVFEEYGIAVSGIFASDAYVRGHSFAGHIVHKISEIEKYYDDFVIVLAFAAGYQRLYDDIKSLAAKYTLYAPDVPVAGSGLFTYKYFMENIDKFEKVYDMLADEQSRKVYTDIINFKISGKTDYLDSCTTPVSEVYENIIKLGNQEIYADLGAYKGDTIEEFLSVTGGEYKKIYAVEPSTRNFKALTKNTSHLENIKLINGASWNKNEILSFADRAGRMACTEKKIRGSLKNDIQSIILDEVVDGEEYPTFIKLDVEGAERKSLEGAKKTVAKCDYINCAVYHRNEDMFDIPLLINSINPNLKLYIRHHLYIPAWETNLYCAR